MEAVHIAIAFAFGYAARQMRLPPLVGFLSAGLVLHTFGVRASADLRSLADFGVTLLLFSIGLKLKPETLLRPEVWGTALIHMAVTVLVFGAGIFAVGLTGVPPADGLSLQMALLIAFALSFSSTVFAVKAFEERGEMASTAGRIAIGILIVQDLTAVAFLTLSSGSAPSPWSLALLGLPLIRPLLAHVLTRSGRGELLVLLGILLPLAGGALFRSVGLKPDLGAIIFGLLLAGHPKAGELSRSLLNLKDLFLVGFFLMIGLSAAPTLSSLGFAVLLVALMPLKVALLFFLLTRFRLRARPAALSSMGLANYSEFGLIVGTVAFSRGWIAPEWLVVTALATSMTFVLASPLNGAAHAIYARFESRLRRFESDALLPADLPIDPGQAEMIVVGMGRTGTSVYNRLRERHGDVVLGIDRSARVVERQERDGRRVVLGDATDLDFWKRIERRERVRRVMLTMRKLDATKVVARIVKRHAPSTFVAAMASYGDEIEKLNEAGVDRAFDLYAEAGVGFAEDVIQADAALPPSEPGGKSEVLGPSGARDPRA